jgi:hypothetical protein
MITLYRKEDDAKADQIEERFKELVISYKIVEIDDPDETHIRDGEKVVQSEEEINDWLFELQQELNRERSITADACYIDPVTGEVC